MLRSDFPIFKRKDLVYLDSAASTQKPRIVVDALNDFYLEHYANVHRGVYPLSEEATSLYEKARDTVARFIRAQPREIVFVKNATEAVNLIARSWGSKNIGPGDGVLVTVMEHHSNFVPWQQLAREKRASFRVLPVGAAGLLDLGLVEAELRKGVKLFACTHTSNVLGTINPIEELVALAHLHGATVVVDGAQAASHLPVDVKAIDADFFIFSGHKVYGPTGIGVLYGKRELLESMPPFLFGGDMIQEVNLMETTFNEVPYKFEAGTPPVAEAVALASALEYLESVGFPRIVTHEKRLAGLAIEIFERINGVEVYGPDLDRRIGIVSFNVDNVHPHDVAGFLGSFGVCVRAGHHCAQPLHEFMGIAASVRLSIGLYNTEADLEVFADHISKLRKIFTGVA